MADVVGELLGAARLAFDCEDCEQRADYTVTRRGRWPRSTTRHHYCARHLPKDAAAEWQATAAEAGPLVAQRDPREASPPNGDESLGRLGYVEALPDGRVRTNTLIVQGRHTPYRCVGAISGRGNMEGDGRPEHLASDAGRLQATPDPLAPCSTCHGSGFRVVNPDWPSGDGPYCERCPEGCDPPANL